MISVINKNLNAGYIRFEIYRKKKRLQEQMRKFIWCPYRCLSDLKFSTIQKLQPSAAKIAASFRLGPDSAMLKFFTV